jgi:hypothetical protein
MQSTGAVIVRWVMRRFRGPFPMPADQLAVLLGLYLARELVHQDDVPEDCVGVVLLLDSVCGSASEQRTLAHACARQVIAECGGDVDDAALVEYVAQRVCLMPRSIKAPVATVPEFRADDAAAC